MFKIDKDGKIVLNINTIDYIIDNNSDYKKLVLLLTNPILADQDLVSMEDLELDTNLEGENRQLCEKYRDFIKKFLETRKEIIQSQIEEIKQ